MHRSCARATCLLRSRSVVPEAYREMTLIDDQRFRKVGARYQLRKAVAGPARHFCPWATTGLRLRSREQMFTAGEGAQRC
jgi:hypothetical protein